MRKLLLCALLATLPACCKPSPTTPSLPQPCELPDVPPPPHLHPTACGDSVCLTVDETRALAVWIQEVKELRLAVSGCSLVKTMPADAGVSGFRAAVPAVSTDPRDVALAANVEAITALLSDGLELHVRLMACGDENAFYSPKTRELVVCRELSVLPDAVQRFIVAHEIGHAEVDQRHLPITGSPEEAADEFAAVALIVEGHTADVIAAGGWMLRQPDAASEDPTDDHFSLARRGYAALCFADGSSDTPMLQECRVKFVRAVSTWSRLLGNDR